MNVSEGEDDNSQVQYGPKTREERDKSIIKQLKTKFNTLNQAGKNSELYKKHVEKDRVVVDVELLLPLFEEGCQHASCCGKSKVTKLEMDVGVLRVSWECCDGDKGYWTSSRVLCQKHGQDIYATSLLLGTAVMLTGNNYDKVKMFCQFLGLGFISRSTYNRIQRNYINDVVFTYWEEMKAIIWDVLSGETIILCGDGRNDSPGHSAKYCTYVLMEQFLDIIVDLDVTDKRETGGVSTNMEVFYLKKLLEKIVGKLMVSEIVTDASTAVMALVRKMKGT